MRRADTVRAVPRDAPTVAFGLAVRWYREERGWSQETLAYRAGLHPTYVGQIERGEKSSTIPTIFKLSAGLELATPELFAAAERFLG
jgi:transcriptional regulator with XRE-family HTH domain